MLDFFFFSPLVVVQYHVIIVAQKGQKAANFFLQPNIFLIFLCWTDFYRFACSVFLAGYFFCFSCFICFMLLCLTRMQVQITLLRCFICSFSQQCLSIFPSRRAKSLSLAGLLSEAVAQVRFSVLNSPLQWCRWFLFSLNKLGYFHLICTAGLWVLSNTSREAFTC